MGARLAIGACPARRPPARTESMFLHRTPIRLVGLTAVIAAGLAATSVLAFQPPSAVDLAQQGDDPAWAITEGLTTAIGPRPAGSDREAAARKWAVAPLDRMGFSNVREESERKSGGEGKSVSVSVTL